jgi:hypothetical protein
VWTAPSTPIPQGIQEENVVTDEHGSFVPASTPAFTIRVEIRQSDRPRTRIGARG